MKYKNKNKRRNFKCKNPKRTCKLKEIETAFINQILRNKAYQKFIKSKTTREGTILILLCR